ncbi:PPOX class F420-dependent oxidoreductase [Ilumatobacter nonamiensis]|uniref:PPOX class F420-dependent oxidoreductase n=1 Tax=Ilumatobacter nonamiensis TaxID=467093 RepID=UPI0003459582|nr:PPOX class F420-dependent oxidoreductase [Ilumatobacter nonamiensis]
MAAITDEKYVALTTFKKDGTAKTLPVWIADFGGGQVGFTTSSSSYKVKRIANDPRVTLQPSDHKGNVKDGSEAVTGTAEVRTGPEFEPYKAVVKKKYGFQYTAMGLVGKFMSLIGKGSGTDSAVVITLD